MSAGLQVMFRGDYGFKLPPDYRIVVGPVHHYPLPETYLDNSRKYASQVQIKSLPDGGHTIAGYVAVSSIL
jgi:hypothetical protein